jgi:hypothetical protein
VECETDVDGDPRIDPQASAYLEWSVKLSDGRQLFVGSTGTAQSGAAVKAADAYLIAAAPDMAEALENLIIAIGMGWDLDGVIEVAQAALAKARGQS